MLINTRDLGGMKTSDGKTIVHGKLLRGGMLARVDDADIAFLESVPVTRIVDFRTPMEVKEVPDKPVRGVEFICLPPLKTFETGITRERKTEATLEDLLKESVTNDPGFCRKYFADFYRKLVTDEYAMSQYAKFLQLMAEDREGATLWHCTAGKDRVGTAAIFIEEILGVSEKDIFDDYMLTNEYLESDIKAFMKKYEDRGPKDLIETIIIDCFGTREAYIDALYDSINTNFGGMKSFLKNQLGVTDEMKEKMRSMYLA